jgi:iron complex transport system substrate-binding protein
MSLSSFKPVFFVLLLAAVAFEPPPAGAEKIFFRDKLDRQVAISAPCRRVVLFETYELLPITGAWASVAGLSHYAFQNELMLKSNPALASQIANAGSAMEASLERLFALNADLVITWPSEKGDRQIGRWSETGLPVISVYPESLVELYELMRLHGQIFEAEAKIETAIVEMEKIFSLLALKLAGLSEADKKSALWLFTQPNKVAGGAGVSQVIFDLIRVKNGAGNWPKKIIDLNLETIHQINPNFIFIWGDSHYAPGDLLKRGEWRQIEAVETRQVYKAPPWSTFSPRLAPLALMMAAKVYPEKFQDIDVEGVVNSFYYKLYGFKNDQWLLSY